jgi:hypothetical protein
MGKLQALRSNALQRLQSALVAPMPSVALIHETQLKKLAYHRSLLEVTNARILAHCERKRKAKRLAESRASIRPENQMGKEFSAKQNALLGQGLRLVQQARIF